MDKPVVRISVRNLVEFILRSGDLDNRGGSSDREAMQKGSRLHRKIQGRMGSHYRAEVSLKYKTEYEDVSIQVEGRADGIFTEDGQCWIDEIKGVYADVSQLEKPVEVHRAQAMCYAWIYAQEQKPEKIGVQMTYGNLDTEELKFFREEYTLEELGLWYQNLLDRYHKWIAYQFAWKKERNASMSDLEFPFEYREGQRKIVSGVYHTISTERQIFVQAPTGVGKTTTIAKIASSFKLEHEAKVAFITADTYRIAAVEQLNTYASIIDCPVSVVYSVEDMDKSLTDYKDYDLILIDTAGRSHKADDQMDELKSFIEQVVQRKDEFDFESYLTLSVTTKYKDLKSIADKYDDVDWSIIFTKLDETCSLGNILNLRMLTDRPLAYTTSGQNVPNDIEVINEQWIAKQLLGGGE